MRTLSLERLAAWDRGLCRRFNSASQFGSLRVVLVIAGRLGNGAFWYALMAALIIWGGPRAGLTVVHMIAVGLVCTLIYKALKKSASRARPYAAQPGIALCAVPLDKYSFPSGHTLHATAFTLIALGYYPDLFWLLVPFSLTVAASRIVLGLHYPSDVLAGAGVGAVVASASIVLFT